MDSAVDVVMRIHRREDDGHVLLFLTGQDEIERACAALRKEAERMPDGGASLLVLPLYSALPADAQARVFEDVKEGVRKVVVCTNIAETSVTVDGVRFVVDPGFVKQKHYDAERGMETLSVIPISRVAAAQRAGRAGRTRPGKCFRLYSKESFEQMEHESIPEIQRSNMANTVLYLKVSAAWRMGSCMVQG